MQFKKIILDADIYIKLNGFERVQNTLYRVVSQITEKAYIHQYVNEEEILTKRDQLQKLISEGIVEVLNPDIVLAEAATKSVYTETKQTLFKELLGEEVPKNKRGKHFGEVHSLAIAKALSIPVFMSDEGNLQPIVNRLLNTGIDDITVFRLKNILLWMKENTECGFNKNDAKAILFGTTDRQYLESNKVWFKENW